MGGIETYLDCWMCKHFDGDGLKSTGRSCKLHDFVQPRAGSRFVCRDLDCMYGDKPELALLEPFERGMLLYHAAPYAPRVYRFAPFSEVQHRVFDVNFMPGRHYDKSAELPEYVFPLGMAQMLWKPMPPRETRIRFGERAFRAWITVATDTRNNDTQPLLHSGAALPELLEWSGFNRVKAELERMKSRFAGYQVFLEIADDLSEFRVLRHEVSYHMPEDFAAMRVMARKMRRAAMLDLLGKLLRRKSRP